MTGGTPFGLCYRRKPGGSQSWCCLQPSKMIGLLAGLFQNNPATTILTCKHHPKDPHFKLGQTIGRDTSHVPPKATKKRQHELGTLLLMGYHFGGNPPQISSKKLRSKDPTLGPRIRLPTFSVVHFTRGTLPQKRNG